MVLNHSHQDLRHVLSVERLNPGQHLVQDHTHRKHVVACVSRVTRFKGGQLLWRHVRQRSTNDPRFWFVAGDSQVKVQQQGVSVITDKNIRRFQVAVNDSTLMRVR